MRDKKESDETISVEGKLSQSGKPRRLQQSGASITASIPHIELVRQAVLRGMDVIDFVKNFDLVFYNITPPGGNVILDGVQVIRFERRRVKTEK